MMRGISRIMGAALLTAYALAPPSAAAQTLTLERLQELGRQDNPTLDQVAARRDAAIADTAQSGLWPNLRVSYHREDVNMHRSQGLFFTQVLPISGRLGAAQAVHARDADLARVLLDLQRLKVENSVRLLYRDLLIAEREVALQEEVVALVEEELQVVRQLVNIGLEDRTDVLEHEMALEHARLDLNEKRREVRHLWTDLAQMVGDPGLRRAELDGDAMDLPPSFDYDMALARLLADSPELRVAEAEIAVAQASLRLEQVEARPDLTLEIGYRYNSGAPEDAQESPPGWEAAFRVNMGGFLWNRNQHGVRAGELDIIELNAELERVELGLRSRFDDVFHEYVIERAEFEDYRDEILPRAEQVHALALGRYEDFGEDYGEVLEARGAILEVRGKLLETIGEVWSKAILIEGLLLAGGLAPPNLHLLENSPIGTANVEFE